jgi:hypothetical protein
MHEQCQLGETTSFTLFVTENLIKTAVNLPVEIGSVPKHTQFRPSYSQTREDPVHLPKNFLTSTPAERLADL